jgi:hypothetical protein
VTTKTKQPGSTPTAGRRIPAILTSHAMEALRDSGYDLPAALGEPIDNSLEANANTIHVRLDEASDRHEKKHIHRIVIADDGEGMDEETVQNYLVVGFSTRYMRKDTIGKYGVGAKLAALNFGRRIDVWSRTGPKEPWRHAYFDLDEAMEQENNKEVVGIDEPTTDPVPDDLQDLLSKGSGTVVVWSKVDRLEEGRRAADANELRLEVEKELSRIFRYFLGDGIRIFINGKSLLPHDPLLLMERTWVDNVLTEHHRVGANPKEDGRAKGDGKAKAKDTGRKNKDEVLHFPATIIWQEPIPLGAGQAKLRITLYPKEVTRKRGLGKDKLAIKLRLPENEGAISFVRLNREISYTNVPRIFPWGVKESDRFIGIEVAFTPELDSYFGVRNVKRGVEPHGELRKKVHDILKKYLPTARERLDEAWGEVARDTGVQEGEHAPILNAAKDANRTLPKSRAKGPEDEAERQRILGDLARDVGKKTEEEKQAYLDRIKTLPFVVESVDFPGTHFIDVQHLDGQVIIRVNSRHRFYRQMWEPIRDIATRTSGTVSGEEAVQAARRTIEALTLLVIAYGKAESMHETPREQYGDLRNYWGHFIDSLMGKIKNVL